MAEQMSILNAEGHDIGTVVVESPAHQQQVAAALAAQGLRLQEPLPPPVELERGGDLEADDCKEDLQDGEVDNCAVAVSVSYTEDLCRRIGIPVPRLHTIVASKRLEGSGEARAAMEECVAMAQTANLTPAQAKELHAYVHYAFPDLAARLPQAAPATEV